MAQKPIGFYGKFTPTSIDNTVGDRFKALAGLSSDVGQLAVGIGKAKAAADAPEQAERAVATAREEGTELEKRSVLSWGGTEYNNAAVGAYYAGVTSDMQNAVLDSQANNPDDLVAYQTEVDAKVSGLLKNAPEIVKAKADRYYSQINSAAVRRVNAAAKTKADEFLAASFAKGFAAAEDNISNLYFDGDTDSAREAEMQLILDGAEGVKAGFLDQQKVDSNLNRVRDTATIQTQLGVIDRTLFAEGGTTGKKLQKADAFVTALRDSVDLSDLNATQKATVIASVQSKINSVRTQYQKTQNQQTREQMLEISDLRNAINLNVGSFEEQSDQALSLFNREIITGNELTTIRKEINSAYLKDHTKLIGIANVQAVLAGTPRLNSDPITPANVNDAYELMEFSDDLDEIRAQQVNFVNKVRQVPSTLKQELTNKLKSPDAIDIESASRTIDAIQDIPGVGETAFNKTEIAFASQVNTLDKYTDDTEGAIAQARQIVTPGTAVQAAMVRARQEEIKDKDNKNDFSESYADEASSIFKSWVPFSGDVKGTRGFALMTEDYGKLVESYYLAGMDTLENAKSKAAALIKANWGNTKEFGLMHHSVDKYYAVGDEVAYVKTELVDILSTEENPVLPKDIHLESDGETSRGASIGKPTYRVLQTLPDGTLISPFMDDGQGGETNRFIPDVEGATALYKENIHLEKLAAVETPYGKTKFKSKTSLTTSQQDAMRKALQSSNSPFALIGKGINAASKVPSLITIENVKILIDQTGAEWGLNQIADAYDYVVDSVTEASDNYVASMKKAGKKQKNIAKEMKEIDDMINENLVEFQDVQTPVAGAVIISPSATEKEQEKGVIPEDFAMLPRPITASMVSEMLSDKTVAKQWKDKYKIVVDKVGPVDAEIIFNHYFGEPITNVLTQGN
jgi:hypothetical protein